MSSAQMITEHHATLMLPAQETQTQIPHFPGVGKLIVQMDGSMIPFVETQDLINDSTKKKKRVDRRKTRTVGWREAKVCLAHPHGCVKLTYVIQERLKLAGTGVDN